MPPKPKKKNDVPVTASRIEELRSKFGDSQTAFAARIGTIPSSVSKWEAGRNRPTPEIFARLSRIAEGSDKLFFLDQAGIPENYFEQREPPEKKVCRATDPELLADVLEAVTSAANKLGVILTKKKYAEIVSKVYDSWLGEKHRDCSIVDRMVDLARSPSNRKVKA
jgi:transcriptional regulator with XRE-family HTH domain